LTNEFEWTLEKEQSNTIKYMAGVDISFVKGNNDACAALVVLEYPSLNVRFNLNRIALSIR
jgi:deoxyinosine 3'endonuclease (endonuclease V)